MGLFVALGLTASQSDSGCTLQVYFAGDEALYAELRSREYGRGVLYQSTHTHQVSASLSTWGRSSTLAVGMLFGSGSFDALSECYHVGAGSD